MIERPPSAAPALVGLFTRIALSPGPAVRAETSKETLAGSAAARGGGLAAPFRWEWKRPANVRFERTVLGVTEIQPSDGETARRVDPPSRPDPEPLSALDLASLNDAADLLGALVDPREKGHRVELVGETGVEGTPAWELRVGRTKGFVETLFLEPEHLVEIRRVEEHPLPGRTRP